MGEKLIDDLARTLATPMPRRRALGTIGVTPAAALPGVPKAFGARRIACCKETR